MRKRAFVVLSGENLCNQLGYLRKTEKGKIPFHHVGTHRRVYLKDLQEYRHGRDQTRHSELAELFSEVDKAGVYDAVEYEA